MRRGRGSGIFKAVWEWLRRPRADGKRTLFDRIRGLPARRQPNTRLEDLKDFKLGDVWRQADPRNPASRDFVRRSDQKLDQLGRLRDWELEDAVLQPRDGAYITAYRDGRVVEGNHRLYEMLRRAGMLDGTPRPPGSTFSPQTQIYVKFLD
ncbi:hypothetical protein GCM10022251_25480 [Phytohabitans flavus]|uniref:Uncharacterized protein n=1 Tax=Phytohabitans flavus TaxID=1076124 RepID=A0A6F8XR67_9ACTN|nr:hypothetical protein [Phytohabitans flavus]BCB76248.1 hypothetical protein Pflav_026580 [Phytohabitans flavus]